LKNEPHVIVTNDGHGSFKSYVLGFALSIALTIASYLLVVEDMLTGRVLVSAIVGLCLTQVLVQLVLFLHLGQEAKPSLNLLVFLFMVLVVLILVFGSLWIMYNLDYRMMPTMQDSG